MVQQRLLDTAVFWDQRAAHNIIILLHVSIIYRATRCPYYGCVIPKGPSPNIRVYFYTSLEDTTIEDLSFISNKKLDVDWQRTRGTLVSNTPLLGLSATLHKYAQQQLYRNLARPPARGAENAPVGLLATRTWPNLPLKNIKAWHSCRTVMYPLNPYPRSGWGVGCLVWNFHFSPKTTRSCFLSCQRTPPCVLFCAFPFSLLSLLSGGAQKQKRANHGAQRSHQSIYFSMRLNLPIQLQNAMELNDRT